MHRKTILLARMMILLPWLGALAQPAGWKLVCTDTPRHGETSIIGARYERGQRDFGFDLAPSPQSIDGTCIAGTPFFVSVREPDGDYRVTVLLGAEQSASVTSVKAEARRLIIWNASTQPGQAIQRSFVVHVRTPAVNGSENVRLKPREVGNLDWDEKLTLEFTGDHASLRRIEIQPVRVPTVYLAGDSTVVDQDEEPWAAWGQMLPAFFNPKIAVANEAESGETIASFAAEHRFDKIFSTLRSGDYLLMEFAHNDQKPGRGFVSISEYKSLLRRYIAMTRKRKARPILVTSMNRRRFSADGRIVATLGEYPDAMREVAREEKVPLIDLNAMSRTLFEAMGPNGTLKAFVHYPANTYPGQIDELKDDTHFNSYGALELAKCVVEAIREQNLSLAKFLNPDPQRFDPAHPDPPSIWELPTDPFWSQQKPYER
jgi:lysophospholipase L1-like esterase